MKKKYIVREFIGWQLGADYYGAGSVIELTDDEYKHYKGVVKLELVEEKKEKRGKDV